MKRFRVGLLGFGWAVAAGSAAGADVWYPAAQPAPSARVVPAGGVPQAPAQPVRPVQAVVRPESEPMWLPAPSATPPSAPPTQPPKTPPIPSADETPTKPPAGNGAQPRPMPKPLPPGDVLPIPRPPEMQPPQLPGPQVLPPQPELPVAPPPLMIPAGAAVPGRHGTFGSPPIRLSRDYPSLADLHDGPGLLRGESAPPEAAGGRGFVQGEYLMWWMSPLDIPVLATTNTQGGRGFLGEPGTVAILGPDEFIGPFRQGFRVRAGWWFANHPCGVDGSFFFLGRKTADAVFTSEQFGIITRPIFSPNPLPGGGIVGQTGEAVTVPGILTGSLSADAESVLWGFDANLRKCLFTRCNARATWFVGFRNLNLHESVSVTENITVAGPGGDQVNFNDPIGTVVVVRDSFETRNNFYGGQIGGTYERRFGRFVLDARASVAFGVTHQELEIDGFQVRTRPGMAPMTFRGGLLAAGPNLGTFTRDEFSVVPEVTLNLGYQVTPRLRAYVGYNFLYWPKVIRPGDQIDTVVDLTFVPNAPAATPSGQNRPAPLFKQTDLWVQGIQFGIDFRW